MTPKKTKQNRQHKDTNGINELANLSTKAYSYHILCSVLDFELRI